MRKRTEVIVASAILVLVLHTLTLSVLAFSSGNGRERGRGWKGKGKPIGVGIYQDNECTIPLSSIDWGILGSGSSRNFACYIRNEGKSASILSMYISNWVPSKACEYIALSWDYGGQSIDPYEVVQVVFTLSTSAGVEGITSFSFDFTIAGSR